MIAIVTTRKRSSHKNDTSQRFVDLANWNLVIHIPQIPATSDALLSSPEGQGNNRFFVNLRFLLPRKSP